jgi:hypothetical protein
MDMVSFWTQVHRWRLVGIGWIFDSHQMFADWQADRDRREAEAVHSATATSSTSPMPSGDIYDSDNSGELQGIEGGESEMKTIEEEVVDEDVVATPSVPTTATTLPSEANTLPRLTARKGLLCKVPLWHQRKVAGSTTNEGSAAMG